MVSLHTPGVSLHVHHKWWTSIPVSSTLPKWKLHLQAELALFKLKMSIACCETEIIWLHMSYSNLKRLNKVKAIFRRLSHANILSAGWSIVFHLGFMNSSAFKMLRSAKGFIRKDDPRRRTKNKITTNPCNKWKVANFKLCCLYTRTAHGFLYCICNQSGFQDISWTCKCTMHGEYCLRYHILLCSERIYSLTHYTNDKNFVQL
jgi:hypothetical protein